MTRLLFTGSTCVCLCMFLVACSSRREIARSPQVMTVGLPAPTPTAAEIVSARAELAALPCPSGCDPVQFTQLQAALDRLLAARLEVKSTAELADEGKNEVTDAQIVPDGAGDFNLTWTYKNVGDYSSDGEVNVSDLMPLGVHLSKTSASPDWAIAQAADGDGNGEANIADLMPIGVNLRAEVSGYNIYQSNSAGGPWATLGSVALADATSGFPRTFTFALGATPPAFILVSARDASGADWQGGPDALPAEVNLGNDVPLATQTFSPGGGFISGPSATPLEGYTLIVPAGAFDTDTEVTLGYNDGTIIPVAGELVGPIIELSTDYGQEFEDMLKITVPHDGGPDDIAIPFYVTPDGRLEYCEIVSHGTGFVTFGTYHASDFAVILARALDPLADFYDTKFDPKKHGFQIRNLASPNFANESFGMVAFAQYHFQGASGNLYPQYMDKFPDTDVTRQQVLATRAHTSVSRVWQNYIAEAKWQTQTLTDAQEWLLLQYTMVNSRRPIIIVMGNASAPDHAVLAYAFVGDEMFIYDPYWPGEHRSIRFTGTRLDYQGATDFATIGHGMIGTGTFGALEPRENFSRILAEVKQAPSPDAFVSSAHFGGTVLDYHTSLSLLVASGSVNIEEVVLTNDGRRYLAKVKPGGLFEFPSVYIRNGANYFYVQTRGFSAQNKLIDVPNNFTNTQGFLITGEHPGSTVMVELTWDNSVAPEPYDMDFALKFDDTVLNSAQAPQTDQYGGEIINSGLNSGGPDLYILTPSDEIPWGAAYDCHVRKSTPNCNKTKYTVRVIVNDKVIALVSSLTDFCGDPEPLDPPPAHGPSGGWTGAFGFQLPSNPNP
jgi:hypothetical protein